MRFLSPSSRLVTVVVAVAVAAVLGAGARSQPTKTVPATGPAAIADGSPLGSDGSTLARLPTEGPPEVGSPPAVTPDLTRVPATPIPTGRSTPKPVACRPTDQDRYVYNPYRLDVQAPCIRVTGIVQAVRREADGDFHILLALDAKYRYLLRPANQGEELGDLVVEPVCVRTVTQLDAEAICASDPDPLPPPYPVVGERIWMEGRYVFDLDHGGWAELHPLYRWGDN
jgi:hypothetical protein